MAKTWVELGLLQIPVFLDQDLPGVPALLEAIALSIHLKDVDTVSAPVEKCSRQPLGAKDLGPLVKGQVGGYENRTSFVPLAEHLEEQLSPGL